MQNNKIETEIKKLVLECETFYNNQLKRTKKEIYENCYQINFYESMRDYFETRIFNENTQDILEEIFPTSMEELYNCYKKNEYASVDNFELIEEFLSSI